MRARFTEDDRDAAFRAASRNFGGEVEVRNVGGYEAPIEGALHRSGASGKNLSWSGPVEKMLDLHNRIVRFLRGCLRLANRCSGVVDPSQAANKNNEKL